MRKCFWTFCVSHLAVAGHFDNGDRDWANSSQRDEKRFSWPQTLDYFATSSLGICVIYWRLADNHLQVVYHEASCSAGLAWIPLRAKTVQGLDFQCLLCVKTLRTPSRVSDVPYGVPELRVLCECCDFLFPVLLWSLQIWLNNYTPLECASWCWLVLTAQLSENKRTWLYKRMALWEYLWWDLFWFDQKDIICLQLSISDHPETWGLSVF